MCIFRIKSVITKNYDNYLQKNPYLVSAFQDQNISWQKKKLQCKLKVQLTTARLNESSNTQIKAIYKKYMPQNIKFKKMSFIERGTLSDYLLLDGYG